LPFDFLAALDFDFAAARGLAAFLAGFAGRFAFAGLAAAGWLAAADFTE
jgi:hypothetical protein